MIRRTILGFVAALAIAGPALAAQTQVAVAANFTEPAKEIAAAFQKATADFTAQTGITLQVDAIPWENVNDKLTTAVASGQGPDVVQVGLSLLPIPLTPMSYMIGITHRALVPPSPAARVLLGQLKSVAAELQDAVREADELVAAQRPGAAADR